MTDRPNFGAIVNRLLEKRGESVDHVVRAAGIDGLELESVLAGDVPDQSIVRRLAPALGIHAADLFVLAGLDVPIDFATFDDSVGSLLDAIVRVAIRLPSERRQELMDLVRSMPRADHTGSTMRKPDSFQYGPGAVLVRMLRNRNLNYLNSAKMLYRLAGVGPLSASTIYLVASGKVKLRPDLLFGFATVLSVHVEDLAALLDIQLAGAGPPADVAMREVAGLIWDLRYASRDQLCTIRDGLAPS